jgi:hypothetical protein
VPSPICSKNNRRIEKTRKNIKLPIPNYLLKLHKKYGGKDATKGSNRKDLISEQSRIYTLIKESGKTNGNELTNTERTAIKVIQSDILKKPKYRLLAIHITMLSKGSNATGWDRVKIRSMSQEAVEKLINQLNYHDYSIGPCKRIFIPKAGNKLKLRPLNLFNGRDKVMQQLLGFVLQPIMEAFANRKVMYGGVTNTSMAMGVLHVSKALQRNIDENGAVQVIEGDISKFF